jgi:uncharacterized membrane protein YgcG
MPKNNDSFPAGNAEFPLRTSKPEAVRPRSASSLHAIQTRFTACIFPTAAKHIQSFALGLLMLFSAAVLRADDATIIAHPTSRTVTAGQNATFTIAASGNPAPTYQWQSSSNGTTWTNLANTSPYSGVTSAMLTITGASASLNGRQYRCVVSNSQGDTTSDVATLTVNPNPIITTQPVSQTINVGQRTTFTVAAIGAPTISYRWQILGTDSLWASLVSNTTYSSATTATLTASNVTRDMSGAQYRCYVSNYAGNITSGTATLTVATPPAILTQPTSQTIPSGQNATFTLEATGTPAPTYQWQVLTTDNLWASLSSSTTYIGVTTTRLTVANVTVGMSGAQYRCTLSNMAGSGTSNPATLMVSFTPVAPAITTHPANQTIIGSQNATFTVTATGNPMPSYQWQSSPDGSTWSNITGNGSATTATLTLTAVTTAMNGTRYRCVATNPTGTATSNTATLITAPTIIAATVAAQNLKTQLQASGTATVTVTGTIDLSLVGGATVSSHKTIVGADASSTITGGLTIASNAFNISITGVTFTTGTFAINDASNVTVTHCAFTDTPVSITGYLWGTTIFSWNKFTATPAGPGSAMRISTSGYSYSYPYYIDILLHHNLWDTTLRSDIPTVTSARVFMFNNYITATGNTAATVSGSDAQILSANNIYQDTHNPLATQSTGLLRALDNFTTATTGTTDPGDDIVFVPAYSQIMDSAGIDTPGAATLATRITTYAGNTAGKNSTTPAASVANATAKIAGTGFYVASSGPSLIFIFPYGDSFTLTASATNFIPISHQWYLDNFAIEGATSETYTVDNATDADAGAYAVALTTPAGEIVTSDAFTTPLLQSPISPIKTQNVGVNSGILTYTITNSFPIGVLPWTASMETGGNWTRITAGSSGTDSGTITVAYDANPPGGAQRTATLRLTIYDLSNNQTALYTSIVQAANTGSGGGSGNTGGGSSGGGNSSGSGGGGGGAPSLLWLGAAGVLLALRNIKRLLRQQP